MNRITRVLAISGLGLFAGLTIGAGPAQAAPSTSDSGAKGAGASVNRHWDDDEIVGYYGSLRRCERAGERGEDRGIWDDYDCYRIRRGPHRGDWALEVEYDQWGGGWNRHRPFGHGHGFGGGFGHGFGGFDGGFGGGFHGDFGGFHGDRNDWPGFGNAPAANPGTPGYQPSAPAAPVTTR